MEPMNFLKTGIKRLALAGALYSVSTLAFAASPGDLLNLHVDKSGIHRVTIQELSDAGLNLRSVRWRDIALVNNGEAVPIRYIRGSNPAIEFLAESRDSFCYESHT